MLIHTERFCVQNVDFEEADSKMCSKPFGNAVLLVG